MPQHGLIFRALIASPGDCIEERKILGEEISNWNAAHSYSRRAIAEAVKWETHAHPASGDRPQAIINKQIGDVCDLLIGAFWTRLGTPTGEADSGTAEEIERFRRAGKPVLLYFSDVPVELGSVDRDQYESLVAYRDQQASDSLYWKYSSHSEFRGLLQRHFASAMNELLESNNIPAVDTQSQSDKRDQQRAIVQTFRSDFESFLRKLTIKWKAERDSNPRDIDDGKYILSNAADEVVHFQSMIKEDTAGLNDLFSKVLPRLRQLDRTEVYADGGESFRRFWAEGNEIIEELSKVPEILDTLTYDYLSDPSAPAPDISSAAIEIIRAAVKDRWGRITRSRTMYGLQITTNGINFVTDADPRTEARCEEAIEQLERKAYIADRGHKREVFAVTEKGYVFAETFE